MFILGHLICSMKMTKRGFWSYVFIWTTVAVSSSNLQSGIGMKIDQRPKRRPSDMIDDRNMVTIDLSALRPSLPGLVLYKYGEAAPKLVQVDLSALNPELQPHVIWPQFDPVSSSFKWISPKQLWCVSL